MKASVRIGGGGGFWGDSPDGARQIIADGAVDYLVLDYLAEITMSILARLKQKSPDAGYAPDFVTRVMAPLAPMIAARGVKVVTNAGGMNVAACREALAAVFAAAGVDLKIAVVTGDDLTALAGDLDTEGTCEMFSGAPMPARLTSINAYLGAAGIARALDAGADVVITGRVVDSALVLGPLMHEFRWASGDYDLLSAGSLAGHLLECGPQATGGIFTDWDTVPGWDDMGFPVAICRPDGTFDITKPAGTGGLVTPMTVGEQLCYEVGDPGAYVLPDVTCDWRDVTLTLVGPDVVRVTGARGHAPTGQVKVSATYADGYRSSVTMMIVGRAAGAKAQATGEAILRRAARLIARAGRAPFTETLVEVLGADSNYGTDPRLSPAREVILKLAVLHPDRAALDVFAAEIYPAACAMAQGLTGFAGGRPVPQPVIRLFSCLVDKARVPVVVTVDGQDSAVPHSAVPHDAGAPMTLAAKASENNTLPDGPRVTVPLIALAHGRSGDKGDKANIGLLARAPEYLPWIAASVTAERVADWFRHFVAGDVIRYDWSGLNGFNFLMDRALGGGGVASLRNDPQGKALAQILLDMPVAVPAAWVTADGPLALYATEVRPA